MVIWIYGLIFNKNIMGKLNKLVKHCRNKVIVTKRPGLGKVTSEYSLLT